MFTLFALLAVADVHRLDSPEWKVRECAERRLTALWPFAVDALLEVERSDNPEVRLRAATILRVRRNAVADARALSVLMTPWPVDANALWYDEDLRCRIHRLAVLHGCDRQSWPAKHLPPDYYFGWDSWYPPALCCLDALAGCRRKVGNGHLSRWPIPQFH